ncbi:MAG TPA: acetyl-CoA carboxylase biotin carboxyl carrier protein [Gemmatales bacterium]|nr:acetyl-CoA carboxylase biotin carboxyl carrier protein [Gemmatales bacterium]
MAEGSKSKGGRPAPGPFDVKTIHYLVRLMGQHDLSQIDLRDGDKQVRLQRGTKAAPAAHGNPGPAVAPAPAASAPPTAPAKPAAPAEATATRPLLEIKSPTPGTFYSAASPDAPPFISVGSKVKPDTIVCIIEAMKVFNEIPAEVSGTVVAILVENQQSVEYGQVLFKVDPG